MSQHDDRLYLLHMFESATKAQEFIAGKARADYDQDEMLRLALKYLVQTIGEAASRVSEARRAALSDLPWRAIIGMLHRIVHGYATIDDVSSGRPSPRACRR